MRRLPARLRRRAYLALPIVAFSLATFAFMPRALLGQRTFAAVDILEEFSPYRDAAGHPTHVVSPIQGDQPESLPAAISFYGDLRQGVYQKWDPNYAAGTPTGILPINGLLSPLNYGFLFLPAWYAVGVAAALSLLLSQFGMYLLMRRLGTGPMAATIAGVAYTFSGANLVLLHRVNAVFILPMLLWSVTRLVRRPSGPSVAATALLLAWAWSEGFPAGFVYCFDVAALWAVWLIAAKALREHGGLQRRLAGVGPALGAGGLAAILGVGISAVTMIPFVSEVLARGLLDHRNFSTNHLPTVQFFGLFDLNVYSPIFGGPWWSGPNPVESVAFIGLVVAGLAAAGLALASAGKLRLTADGWDAWGFGCVLTVLLVILNFVGGPLLQIESQIPGLSGNPINRTRFLIALGAAMLAGLALDAWWNRRADCAPAPRLLSVGTLGLVAALGILNAAPFIKLARGAHVGRALLTSVLIWAAVTLALLLFVFVARRLPRLRLPAGLAILLVLWLELALPLRGFTPEAPKQDFYTQNAGFSELQSLLRGRYRFAASFFTYLPNTSQVFQTPDLRGLALYSNAFRRVIGEVNPKAFDRDPLKILLMRDEWKLDSPILDDLAVRYFVLGTDEQPYGRVAMADSSWDSFASSTSLQPAAGVGTSPGAINGVALPLRASGSCDAAKVEVSIASGGREVARTARPAYDAKGQWTAFALTAQTITAGQPYQMSVASSSPGCAIDAGVLGSGANQRLARQVLVEDLGAPAHLVATTQGWFYERPNASQLVSAHSRWRSFSDQQTLLGYASGRGQDQLDVASFVGTGPASDPGAQPATVVAYHVGDNTVSAETSGHDRSLLVVAQNFSNGWTARVDGNSVPVVLVDGALTGLFVPAGHHHVDLDYSPKTFSIGIAIGITSLVLTVMVAVLPALLRRRRRPGRPANGALD